LVGLVSAWLVGLWWVLLPCPVPVVVCDGNHRSGIRNGGTGGVAVGGIGVCVVGGLSGGLPCPVPVVVCPCIVIGGVLGMVAQVVLLLVGLVSAWWVD